MNGLSVDPPPYTLTRQVSTYVTGVRRSVNTQIKPQVYQAGKCITLWKYKNVNLQHVKTIK